MNLIKVIATLRLERERLDSAILNLERLARGPSREENVSPKEPNQTAIRQLKRRASRRMEYEEASILKLNGKV